MAAKTTWRADRRGHSFVDLDSQGPVYGWTQVEGQIDDITIEARDAPIAEVLAALGTTLGLRIRTTTMMDKVVSGTYRGSLQRVIGRLFMDRNYVAKYTEDALDIFVLGPVIPAATSAMLPMAPAIAATSTPPQIRAGERRPIRRRQAR